MRVRFLITQFGIVISLPLACGGGAPGRNEAQEVTNETPPAKGVVDVGRIDEYASGEPVHFISHGFWLVRIGDDLILALSDRDTDPNSSGDKCREVWRPEAPMAPRSGGFRAEVVGD